MMSAEKARKITNLSKDNAYGKMLVKMEDEIYRAAKSGHFMCSIPLECDNYARKWLKEHLEKDGGYFVEFEPNCAVADVLASIAIVSWDTDDAETPDETSK